MLAAFLAVFGDALSDSLPGQDIKRQITAEYVRAVIVYPTIPGHGASLSAAEPETGDTKL